MADDVDHHTQKLQPRKAQQQQRQAQYQRQQTIRAKTPGKPQQTTHEFAGRVPALLLWLGQNLRHIQRGMMKRCEVFIQIKAESNL